MFGRGVQDLTKANEKQFSSALNSLKIDQNKLSNIDKNLKVLTDSLAQTSDAIKVWEEETKLSAKVGKASIRTVEGKLSAARESISRLNSKFVDSLEELSTLGSEDKMGIKAAKESLSLLEKAESGARNAEGKLKQAKEVIFYCSCLLFI